MSCDILIAIIIRQKRSLIDSKVRFRCGLLEFLLCFSIILLVDFKLSLERTILRIDVPLNLIGKLFRDRFSRVKCFVVSISFELTIRLLQLK